MIEYTLMHGDTPCGTLSLDERTGHILSYKDFGTGASPFLGNADIEKIKDWWSYRAVPASRGMMRDVLRDAGCLNSEAYLAKNLALSMTDTYWICPADLNVRYKEVRLTDLGTNRIIPYHNESTYDPNASLGGQTEKYWRMTNDGPVLVKESSKYFGQQSVNEAFATHVHELQNTDVPFVRYTIEHTDQNSILSMCRSFISENTELVPAYEVLRGQKMPNDESPYSRYIDQCVRHGMDEEEIRSYMDYQTLTDFVINNTDRHLVNFGVVRDSATLKFLRPAPIFDSGNSMFYNLAYKSPLSRVEILQQKITAMASSEEKMLTYVRDKNIVRADLLPSPGEVKEFYEKENLPEQKAEFISRNYEIKLNMLREFQRGETISLYREKKKEKNAAADIKE